MKVICTATRAEMKAALPSDAPINGLQFGQAQRWQGPQDEYFLLLTGIGPINAGISLGKLIGSQPSLSGVINVGIAGSFDLEKCPLLSIAVVGEEIWPEFGMRDGREVDVRSLECILGKGPEGPVWDRIKLRPLENIRKMGLTPPRQWKTIPSLSVSGVTASREQADYYRGRYAPVLENMEGFALAWACQLSGVPFLEIRCVSNLVGTKNKEFWEINKALGCLSQILPRLQSGCC